MLDDSRPELNIDTQKPLRLSSSMYDIPFSYHDLISIQVINIL